MNDFTYNPWVVSIIGGVISSLIAGIILSLVRKFSVTYQYKVSTNFFILVLRFIVFTIVSIIYIGAIFVVIPPGGLSFGMGNEIDLVLKILFILFGEILFFFAIILGIDLLKKL